MSNSEFTLSYQQLLQHPRYYELSVPKDLIDEFTQCDSKQACIRVLSLWLVKLFNWDRASVALTSLAGYLSIVALKGDQAIPSEIPIPIKYTLVGRAFENQTLITCHNLSLSKEHDCIILSEGGLVSCMDAPIMAKGKCYGTINLARKVGTFNEFEALQLFYLATVFGRYINSFE